VRKSKKPKYVQVVNYHLQTEKDGRVVDSGKQSNIVQTDAVKTNMNPKLSYNQILELIDDFDPGTYARTRNHLRGAVSRLSPYITRGVISLPDVQARVLVKYPGKSSEKFIQELAWREYFQKVYLAKGKDIFTDLRYARNDWQHQEVVQAIAEGSTDIEAVDREIMQLKETGYMHNHARMWTAMLACNVAKADWKNMSKWMYYYLIDGDLASNTLSWQWVAGTSSSKRYVADQSLINGCSDTAQQGTYLDIERAQVGDGDVPEVLAASQPFDLKTVYPESDSVQSLAGKTVHLYHPWSINPLWKKDELSEKIFVIEPRLFDIHPVSAVVMDHMLTLLKTHVPDAKIYVGNVETLPDILDAEVASIVYPATKHYPGLKEPAGQLYPSVTGYYPSFFKFWNACQQVI
jgi:deoxyribodipyrimidine photo-lyase